MKRRKLPVQLVDTVREFVRMTAEHCNVTEVEAVELVGRALVEVGGEALMSDAGDTLVSLLSSR